ncbi:GLPGLI family protein [Flavobacterium ardleyense]|uniref:GLPGLI family protein n=1 Tax=Flavobacterium ardleyense TaxID=2038737 RepID=A0ABW5Z731_9FLAO
MYKILIPFFLFSFYLSHGQTTKIEYSLEIIMDKEKTINPTKIDLYNQLNESLKLISFNLVFNDTISKFYIPETNAIRTEQIAQAISFSGLEKPMYYFAGNTYAFGEKSLLKELTYLVKNEINKNWIVHNDTIRVNGYKCYKATSSYTNSSEKIFTDIVWFAPSIPTNFGPNGTGSLPGAILIFQHASNVYKAKKIVLNSDEKIDFKLTNKVISEKEYLDLWRKWEEDEFGTN